MGDPLALTSMACAVPYRRPISIELCHTVERIQVFGPNHSATETAMLLSGTAKRLYRLT